MSSKSLGRLSLDLVADIGGFTSGMTAAERQLDRSTSAMERQAKARAAAIQDAFKNMAGAIAGPLAAAFSVSAIVASTTALARNADEWQRWARISGTTVEEMQRLAAGSRNAGVEAEKLADIYKDVSDKIGDYLVTGGGALADFFDGVGKQAGVTAEQLRLMSGPDALGLIFSTLEKSGASRNELTFWMEAIAGDATLLIPLLENNAAGFKQFGDEAERLGAILSEDAIEGAAAFNKTLDDLQARANAITNLIASNFIPVFDAAGQYLLSFGEAGGVADMASRALAEALKIVVLGGAGVVTAFETIGKTVGVLAAQMSLVGQLDFEGAAAAGNAYFEDLTRSGDQLVTLFNDLYGLGEAASAAETELAPLVVTASRLETATVKTTKAVKEHADAQKGMADAIKRAHAEAMAAAETDAELLKIAEEGLASLREQVEAQQLQNEEIGMTGKALADLRARRLEDAAAQNDQTAATLAAIPGNEQQVIAYQEKAAALRELATLMREGASAEAAYQFTQDFEASAESIGEYLSDKLYDAFQDGKGFAAGFKRTLESYFKTMVLQPLLAPISAGIAGAASGASGGPGGNLLTTGLQAAGGLSSAFMGGAGWMMGSGATFGGTLTAAGSLIGAGGAGIPAGLALGAGALAPILAPLALLGLSGAFKKPSNKSAWGNADLASGELTNLGNMTGEKQASQGTMDARTVLLQNLAAVGKSLGATGNVGVDVGGREGIQINYDGELRKYGSDVNAALREVYTQMLEDTSGIDSEFRDVIRSMVQSAPDQIAGFLGLVQDNFSVLSTDAERFASVQKALGEQFAAMGVNVPQNVEQFRAIADGLDLTTEEGRNFYAQLTQLAPAFGQVAQVIQQVRDSIAATTASSIRDIQMAGLDDVGKYEFLDGEIAADLEALRSATDPAAIQALFGEINSGVMAAFGLLPDELTNKLGPAFIGILREAEELAGGQLTVAPSVPETKEVDIEGAIARGMAAAATQMAQAGVNQQNAANALATAIGSIPSRIVVESRVSVDASEVWR